MSLLLIALLWLATNLDDNWLLEGSGEGSGIQEHPTDYASDGEDF